jgi:arsenate reductase
VIGRQSPINNESKIKDRKIDNLTHRPRVKIIIYQKLTCTTCRQVHAALVESGVDFDAVNYYVDPIAKQKLIGLLRKMQMTPREPLRTKEPIYKTLRLAERDLSDDEIVDLMVKNPDLIQRPIVEKGARAILARPADRLKEIL